MYFWALLYIWGSTMSLRWRCIRTQTLIKVLYTRLRTISPLLALNKSSAIATFHALKVTNGIDTTYLLIRSSGISLNHLLQRFKPPLRSTTYPPLKWVLTKLWYAFLAGILLFLLPRYYANYYRSLYTYKMPKKPIKQGYKIYGIADHGYIYN